MELEGIFKRFSNVGTDVIEQVVGACQFKHHGGMVTINYVGENCPLCEGRGCSHEDDRRDRLLPYLSKVVGSKSLAYTGRRCTKHGEAGMLGPAAGWRIVRADDDLTGIARRPCAICTGIARLNRDINGLVFSGAAVTAREMSRHIAHVESEAERRKGFAIAQIHRDNDKRNESLEQGYQRLAKQVKSLQEGNHQHSVDKGRMAERLKRRDSRIESLERELKALKAKVNGEESGIIKTLRDDLKDATALAKHHEKRARDFADQARDSKTDVKQYGSERYKAGLAEGARRAQKSINGHRNDKARLNKELAYEREKVENLAAEVRDWRTLKGDDQCSIKGYEMNDWVKAGRE